MNKKLLVLLGAAAMLGGCGGVYHDKAANDRFTSLDRLDNGLVIILPGIEGESPFNHEIREGLAQSGVGYAMPIYNWGRPIPVAGALLNQMDVWGNREAGKRIARFIATYQDHHPGRPVYIIGHSGGGGVAVFAAESLPEDRRIDGLVLLSASISNGYDLTKAMDRCRSGIVNFYSTHDVAFLGLGTTLAGNVDGSRGAAAGLTGFDAPSDRDRVERQVAYRQLYQVKLEGGGLRAHTATTNSDFVRESVAPWLTDSWPAERVASRGGRGEEPPRATAVTADAPRAGKPAESYKTRRPQDADWRRDGAKAQ